MDRFIHAEASTGNRQNLLDTTTKKARPPCGRDRANKKYGAVVTGQQLWFVWSYSL